jgi:hypothetical protein
MKQKDLAVLIIVIAISVAISFFVSKLVFSTPADRSESVDVVPSISSSFPTPSSQYFNSSAIDPTQLIKIGNSNNTSPFNASAQ